ncbi:bifunctional adenosylcobinamide kinase/adenosylcobinamide-phosphate guanylyltransferase [Yoonia sp.]|uniref:bifunctional adenosylcobinamide kinase/adenosylcobinamide-phosphate guanylyltransferase n=1 Tax=Yoonia sp. TaxID=2212373 RepID=UPI0025CD6DD4|nr:bifunctional adenosylcobinamide kinase/adenosylcobinamide-phosphate guanylyltransferase [Yoonia sp.]
MTLPNLTLVLGGAASGKSAYAERLVLQGTSDPVYIATAQVFDDEMAAKVSRHRDLRGDGWTTIEEPINVAGALEKCQPDQAVLIDCATLWLTNIMLNQHDLAGETAGLRTALRRCSCPVVIVSNEVGQGIVPDNALSRNFRNAQGTLNQVIAADAGLVVAVMAGLPLALKGTLP